MRTQPLMALALATFVGGCLATVDDETNPAEPGSTDQAAPADAPPSALIPEHLIGHQLECVTASQCSDGNPCTLDACVDNSCRYTMTQAACNDGDACTIADRCDQGVCRGEAKVHLLDGNASLEQQNWSLLGETHGVKTVNYALMMETVKDAWSLAHRKIDEEALIHYDVEFLARIETAAFGEAGGAATFFMSYDLDKNGTPHERSQGLMFGPDQIGWADYSDMIEVPATEAHLYRVHVAPGGERVVVFVDGVARLTREDVELGFGLAFGDASDEHGVDGRYIFSDIGFVPRIDACLAN